MDVKMLANSKKSEVLHSFHRVFHNHAPKKSKSPVENSRVSFGLHRAYVGLWKRFLRAF
jgi:hypothetical protein